ncbi:MAG: hypothetical protein HYU36_23130 [Planctomycetes bacterium]|nr:hypothetical protein [Planctomycetota bacterium]
MDWETHIVLSGQMLRVCRLDVGAALYSVLPAIDIQPIHYHRQYAHLLANVPLILDAAIDILGGPEVAARDFDALRARTRPRGEQLEAEARDAAAQTGLSRAQKREKRDRAYFYRRIAEEAQNFVTNELAGAEKVLGPEAGRICRDRLPAMMSLVSHFYFDTFNNPVATFIPLASNYAAQWDLWKEIDYLKYRASFYKPEVITAFRRQMIDAPFWTKPLDVSHERDPDIRKRIQGQQGQPFCPCGFLKAMVQRLGSLAPGISPNAIDHSIRNIFSVLKIRHIVHADRELLLCLAIEREIAGFIRQRYAA